MPSYQLTLSPNYVPNWGSGEALRELFQNGIDRMNEDPESKFSVTYDPLQRRLILGNPKTTLSKRTLLLGETTKDGVSTLGKYGEGYKLALLVLIRLGCRVTIENSHEVWTPKIIKSRVFNAELIQIDVTKNKNNDGWLRYIIDGLTPELYSDFQDRCLLFHTPEVFQTDYGRILLDDKFSGKVYCNSLFICTVPNLKYGYDMLPKYIQLDRDRRKVEEFNLTWETSRMWTKAGENQTGEAAIRVGSMVSTMISKENIDVAYYHTHTGTWNPIYREVCQLQHDEFIRLHGMNAVVCKDENEARIIKEKYGNLVPVVVPERIYTLVTNSEAYASRSMPSRNDHTPEAWVESWVRRHGFDLSHEEQADELIRESKSWRYW